MVRDRPHLVLGGLFVVDSTQFEDGIARCRSQILDRMDAQRCHQLNFMRGNDILEEGEGGR